MSRDISTVPQKDIATPTQLENSLIKIKAQIRTLPDTCNWYVMHDSARAVEAAAIILKHKDLQVEASIAISEVERIINSMTMAQKKKPRLKTGKADEETIKQEASERELGFQKYRFRQAHEHMSDEKFEELKTEARETGEPLSRRKLIQESKKEAKKSQPQEEQKQETEAEPEQKKSPKVDLKKEISDLHGVINGYEEDFRSLQNDDTKREHAKTLEEFRVFKLSYRKVVSERDEQSKEITRLKRIINAQKARIRDFRDELEKAHERIAIMNDGLAA